MTASHRRWEFLCCQDEIYLLSRQTWWKLITRRSSWDAWVGTASPVTSRRGHQLGPPRVVSRVSIYRHPDTTHQAFKMHICVGSDRVRSDRRLKTFDSILTAAQTHFWKWRNQASRKLSTRVFRRRPTCCCMVVSSYT